MSGEIVIYTDESDKQGNFFSNFYGGALIRSRDLHPVISAIEATAATQNLDAELKWQKVTANYLGKYMAVMETFFDLVKDDKVKVRIMFTSNQYVPHGLSKSQRKAEYHLLYYQFLKHAFGLRHANAIEQGPVRVRLNLDQMPTNREDTAIFRAYVLGLNNNPEFKHAQVQFDPQQMAEVSSRDHILMQCLDVVLGSMVFRLNDKHKAKPLGQLRRGKRTVAKEKLYKYICSRVREIYPNFNFGESTGTQGDIANRWRHPYRHWKLIPKNHERDLSRTKRK